MYIFKYVVNLFDGINSDNNNVMIIAEEVNNHLR